MQVPLPQIKAATRVPGYESGRDANSVDPMTARQPLLLVEDDPEVRASLDFWLNAEGFAIRSYATGGSLLQSGVDPDSVLIIDEHLPDGSGSDLVRAIHARGVPTPAIVITTNPSRALKESCAAAHVEIVEKPLITDELMQAIRRACARRIGATAP